MLKIKIHRGTHQIGGCATEMQCGSTRILIDLGANLPGMEENASITDKTLLDRVFGRKRNRKVDAVLFSHYHGDHIGLYKEMPSELNIPAYIGETARDIMKLVTRYIDVNAEKKGGKLLEKMKVYKQGEKLIFGCAKNRISVTPYQVDHSALDAYMFLIEADNTAILFTGDFREHGILNERDDFWNTVDEIAGKRIDILITEGTMLSREEEVRKAKYKTEADLGGRAGEIFQDKLYNFVVVSSTNLDSIMEFYHNTPENMAFVCDAYQARLIAAAVKGMHKKSSMYGGKKEGYLSKHIYVYEEDGWKAKRTVRAVNEIAELTKKNGDNPIYFECLSQDFKELKQGFVMLIRPNHFPKYGKNKFEKLLEEYQKDYGEQVNIIYSMWYGYVDGKHSDKDILRLIGSKDNIIPLHTSGHAYVETIARLIKRLEPGNIIPMHTEMADYFSTFEEFKNYKDRVVILQDGRGIMVTEGIIKIPNPEFKRKAEYSDTVKEYVKELWENYKDLLLIPNETGFIGYCRGIVLISNLSEQCFNIRGITNDKKISYVENRNRNFNLFTKDFYAKKKEEYAAKMPTDRERRSAQIIALQNMTFKDDEYSVCGFETTISINDLWDMDADFYKKGAPEMDMVLVNPLEETILLVEYKCNGESMLNGKQNLEGHYQDYKNILNSTNFEYIRLELLKSYALLYEMKNNRPFDYSQKSWKTKIAFLFADRVMVCGGNGSMRTSEITKEDYIKAREAFKDVFEDENILYMRVPKITEDTIIKLNYWDKLKKLNEC